VTTLAKAQPQAALAFDQMARSYDNVFTNSMIGRAQRNAVWSVLTKIFQPHDHILELNSGTGEDALFMARNGISVTACDASEQMIQIAYSRLRSEAPHAPILFKLLPTEQIHKLHPSTKFDGIFSNFSGLNCVANLKQAANQMATLLPPGAPLLISLSTRFCLWEIIWFLLHGNFRKAFRRCSGHTIATVGDYAVDVYYPTISKLKAWFAPSFVLRSYQGIGVTVPPSYAESWIQKHSTLLGNLQAIDRAVSALPGFRALGDHVLLHFERMPS
jgi:ubiquinone/menaquinone biosynthesis C-methylase UbiE